MEPSGRDSVPRTLTMNQSDYSLSADLNGQRLDQAVQELLGDDFSRAQIGRLIREGHITLDGQRAKPGQKVKTGQRVSVSIPQPEPVELVPADLDLDILYEDEHLVAINKPPGMVVHPSPGHSQGTLVHGLLHHCGKVSSVGGKQRPGIVHRLDKDTSGVMVAAKSDLAHRRLVAAFAAGHLRKEYLALVWGAPELQGAITAGIGRHPVDRKRMSTKARNKKPAKTTWRRTRAFKAGISLLRVRIHTGRTHQIRVHFSENGHPVLGDAQYGGRRGINSQGRRALPPAVRQAVLAADRQLLHAANLSFTHPVNGGPIHLSAPLPEDFRAVLRALWENDHV